jgi:hypothetical protein
LDCLKKPIVSTNANESGEDKEKREQAVWDTLCAFETTYDWVEDLRRYYKMKGRYFSLNSEFFRFLN